jgi:hypothetical protein
MTPREAIEAAELAEAETAYRLQLAREMYRAGYAQAEADMAARWNTIARAAISGPSFAELEERRWGPGGRGRFAGPRPGDAPGPAAEQETHAEPEPELEIT